MTPRPPRTSGVPAGSAPPPANPPPPGHGASALLRTYRRLTRVCEPLRVTVSSEKYTRTDDTGGFVGAGVTAAALARGGDALDAAVDGESDRILAAHGRRPRRDVAASRLLHHYLWSVCLLISGPWYLERRVPLISLERVRLDPATGSLALTAGGLPQRPGTDDGAELRAAVAAHVGPLLDAFAGQVRRGPRALWGMATDDLASGIWFLGRALGEEEHAVREATAVLPGRTPPFPGSAGFRRLRDTSGRLHPTRTRLGCCLYYTLVPGDPCLTCPRLTDEARAHRLSRTAEEALPPEPDLRKD